MALKSIIGDIFRKRVLLCLFCLAGLVLATTPAKADDLDDSLRIFAVNVHQTPMQSWGPGYGIYLEHGLFVTAAHVAGRTWFTRPKISILGEEFPTRVIRAGDFDTIDLTLLAVDERLLPMRIALRINPICQQPPSPGEPVISVVPESAVRTVVLSPRILPSNLKRFDTLIQDVKNVGNSGSGVFDAQKKCLLGIVSRKISRSQGNTSGSTTYDIARYFIPALEIEQFVRSSAYRTQ